jgi:hypothetical protein
VCADTQQNNGYCGHCDPWTKNSEALAKCCQQQHGGQEHGHLHVVVPGVTRAHAFFKIAFRLFRPNCADSAALAFLYSGIKIGPCGAEGLLMGSSFHQA